jgi:hypothetical protein
MSLAFIAVSLLPDAAPAASLSKTKDIQLLHEEKWSQRRLSFVLLNRAAAAIREAMQDASLADAPLAAKMTLEIPAIGLKVPFDGDIRLK